MNKNQGGENIVFVDLCEPVDIEDDEDSEDAYEDGQARLVITHFAQHDIPALRRFMLNTGLSGANISLDPSELGVIAQWSARTRSGDSVHGETALHFDLCPPDVQRLVRAVGEDQVSGDNLWIERSSPTTGEEPADELARQVRMDLVLAVATVLNDKRACIVHLPRDPRVIERQLKAVDRLARLDPANVEHRSWGALAGIWIVVILLFLRAISSLAQ